MVRPPAALAFLLMLLATLPDPRMARSDSLADTARVRRWREDLRFVVERITTTHPRPFAFASRTAFDSAAAAIEQRIPRTDDAGLAVECMRMVALLGDGHTMLIGTLPQLGFDSVLPLWIRPFEDGLYVGAASGEAVGLAGTRVVSLGGVPADQALERVLSMTSGDNRYTRLDRAPLFLMLPAVWHTLGLATDRGKVTLEIERPGGKRERVTVTGGAPPPGYPHAFLESEPRFPEGWTSARRFGAGGPPRCDRRPEDAWWFEYLPAARVLYLRMRSVDVASNDVLYFEFYRRLFAAADSLKPWALVIDLRQNHGGNNGVLDALVRGIVQRPWLDREGGLFALVDRGTFSAAMNAAVFLENQTRVTFVGEPTGGRVNHYGDAPEFNTPNLGMMAQVSTLFWSGRYPSDDRAWIAPEVATPSTLADWRTGRDAAIEAALESARDGSLGERMLAASRKTGPEAAVAVREAWRRRFPNPWVQGLEGRVLTFASSLLDDRRPEDAAALGEALVRVAPDSYSAWRVLGEANAIRGERARAVECLRKALAVNPRGLAARTILARLGEKP